VKKLTHLDSRGAARMVDVGAKPVVARTATAEARLNCAPATIRLLQAGGLPKGDVLAVARVAGLQAVKQTSSLIPLCHALPLDAASVNFRYLAGGVCVTCSVSTTAKTGVEMEALTGASVGALTLYDMCKAVDKGMSIDGVRVVEKRKASR
jgi:cyclic pyranopterin phosphate synthase